MQCVQRFSLVLICFAVEKIAETINLLPLDAFDVEPSLPAKAVDDLLNNLPIEPTFEAYFNAHAGGVLRVMCFVSEHFVFFVFF